MRKIFIILIIISVAGPRLFTCCYFAFFRPLQHVTHCRDAIKAFLHPVLEALTPLSQGILPLFPDRCSSLPRVSVPAAGAVQGFLPRSQGFLPLFPDRCSPRARESLSQVLSALGAHSHSVGEMLLESCVTELEDVATDTERIKSVPQPVVQESAHPYTGKKIYLTVHSSSSCN